MATTDDRVNQLALAPDVAPAANGGAPAPGPHPPLVPDLAEVHIPRDGRVVIVSDLHLTGEMTAASRGCTGELIRVLEEWRRPGVLVFAGDAFELLHEPVAPIEAILDAHQSLVDAVQTWLEVIPGRRVVVLPGNHDGQIAWDDDLVAVLRQRLSVSQFALALDVHLDTAAGDQKVRVVHGNQNDQYNAFIDPRSPIDTPTGHHVVREILPQIDAAAKPDGLLDGITWLNEPMLAGEMVGSRLLYRRVVGRLWWLLIPFAAALVLRFVAFIPGVERLIEDNVGGWLIFAGVLLILLFGVVVLVAVGTMLGVHHALAESSLGKRAGFGSHNAPQREEAARLIAAGYAGLVSGHTHQPELSVVGTGFYANSGCGVQVLGPRPARFGLPRVFTGVLRCSRVELFAEELVEVRVYVGDAPVGGGSFLERHLAKPDKDTPVAPAMVADLPIGSTWPIDRSRLGEWARRRRVRRWAAGLLVLAGVLDVVYGLLEPSLNHLADIDEHLPGQLPGTASVLALFTGIALLGLARAVRRGYRPAFAAVLALLALSAAFSLLRGGEILGAVFHIVLGLWLAAEHRRFRVKLTGARRWVVWGVTFGLAGVAVAGTLGAALNRGQDLSRVAIGLGIAFVVVLSWLASRPARLKGRAQDDHDADLARGREIVAAYGGDTLDYFALRDDKDLLFTGAGLVAYTVLDRTMLVSPDPICPPEERLDAWADAMDLADSNGWSIAVLAANANWLPIYHAAGLQDTYIGDEAIVDCQRFTLQGGAMKSLRGANNRVVKAGYTVKVMDPAAVDAALKDQLLALMTETRQGDVERGFSMTLSRIFDPLDEGLLLAVCFGPDGVTPMAFNQYVPAAAIGGYSLDVMRRSNDQDAPNGLTDFVILETIGWLRERGYRGLGLNFATFRSVVSGEAEGGPWLNVERKVLHHFSDTMQIESLWKFNEKYGPTWRPRYVVTDAVMSAPRAAVAIARAEGEVEVPVVGRFFKPAGPDPAAAPGPPPDASAEGGPTT